MELDLGARALERWAAPRLAGIVSTRAPDVWVAVGPARATFCVSTELDSSDSDPTSRSPAVAFDLHALVEGQEGEQLVFVVANARGANLGASATSTAIACVQAILGSAADRAGAVFTVPRPSEAVARALLPDAGARVPAVTGVVLCVLAAQDETWILHGARGALPSPPSGDAVRARAIANLLLEGDDALVNGDSEAARSAFLDALERAPRHAEIIRRIVEIDARTKGREEAALGAFAETLPGRGGVHAGTTPGDLFAAVNDVASAMASLEHVGSAEPAPVLASRAYERAATLARDPEDAARWLDHALSRAPRAIGARWARIIVRLTLGRIDDAVADVAHLEALARGGRAKHAVWVRAGRAFQAAGLRARARATFERALRYLPDDPHALAGLGEALVAEGEAPRGVSVLSRALALAESRGDPVGAIMLLMARALAEHLDDLPAAIAHVSAISIEAYEAPVARGLEARWRAALGDVVGASLAFARLREIASSLAVRSVDTGADSPSVAPSSDERSEAIVPMLLEAADLEFARRRDPLAAQRHLAVALRLRPHDADVRRAHREACTAVFGLAAGPRDADDRSPGGHVEPPNRFARGDEDADRAAATSTVSVLHADAEGDSEDEGLVEVRPDHDLGSEPSRKDNLLAARAEELTRRVQADPSNEAASDELASLLETLGRGHELLALMLARLEDSPRERRAALVPRVREVLARLAAASESAGRSDEAALYRTLPLE